VTERFCFTVYIPSLHRDEHIYELITGEYLGILKFIQNNDNIGLSNYLEYIVETKCQDPEIFKNLNRLDKYCIILSLVMVCVGNLLEFSITCPETDKTYNIDITVSDIIPKINNLDFAEITVPIYNDNHMVVSIPDSILGSTDNYIKRLYINNNTFDLSSMTDTEVSTVIEQLPYNVFHHLQDALNDIYEQCDDIVYFTYTSPYVQASKPVKFRFNLYDTSFFDFIKTLLRDDLLSYYKMIYSMISRFKFTESHINNITPAELKMYMSFVKEEVKVHNDRVESMSSKSTSSISPPSPSVDFPDIG